MKGTQQHRGRERYTNVGQIENTKDGTFREKTQKYVEEVPGLAWGPVVSVRVITSFDFLRNDPY